VVRDATTHVAEPPTGELVLGRYRLVRRLGAGGMGVVWLGHDERLDRAVAVKRVAAEAVPGDRAARRAEKEALAAARLGHPAIVALYEAGREEGGYVLVSELVRGLTLARLLRDGRLSDFDVLRIGATLCDALAHAHARGVVHRDVKPSNVICPDRPEDGTPAKLTDFGIAHLVGDGDPLTRTGDVVGTLAYMAPEQARGERVTAAVDVYALGVVLVEALTGVNPVRGAGAADTVANLGRRLPPLRRARRDLPRELCAAIDAAVALAPDDRLAPEDLRDALRRALPEVRDVPGPVGPSALETATRVWTGGRTAVARPWRRRGEEPLGRGAEPEPRDARSAGLAARTRRLPSRLVAAAGAGGLLAAAAAQLPEEVAPRADWAALPAEPVVLAAAVAAGAFVLPRLAWLVAGAAVLVWAALAAPGVALVLLAVLAPVPLLLGRRAAAAWSLPAAAPLLGLAGLGIAFPALAGQARRARTRAALGALGAWWLLLAEPLLGDRLLLGRLPGAMRLPAWDESAGQALEEAVGPLLGSGAVAIALAWALAAAVLPAVVRGRSAAVDLVGAAVWAALLAGATGALAQASGAGSARGLAAGAVVGALLAVGARALTAGRGAEDPVEERAR